MSDNFAITPGSGVTIGSKDIGAGVQAQRILPVHNSGTDTADATPLPTKDVPFTSGGYSKYKSLSVMNASQAVKASAGQLYGGIAFNASVVTKYLKFYDVASGSVTVGTTVPDITIPLKAGETTYLNFDKGIPFATAISLAATGALADNDNTAPTANDVVVTLLYK